MFLLMGYARLLLQKLTVLTTSIYCNGTCIMAATDEK